MKNTNTLKQAIFFAFLGVIANSVFADTEKTEKKVDLGEAVKGHVKIVGKLYSTELTKICIEGQLYFLLGDTGISPVFKDGKPEQCSIEKSEK